MKISSTISGFGGICCLVIFLTILQLTIGDQRLCGKRLRAAADFMCEHGFNGYKTKRGSVDSMPEDDEENFGLSMDMPQFFNSMESNSLTKIRRRRHGISHECCDKPCSLSELKSYCRDPPAL